MTFRLHIVVIVGLVVCASAATFYWARLAEPPPDRREASEHQVFKYLDLTCREKYGEGYSFRTNRCCEIENSSLCAPL
jgi:hypothetical protein